MTEWEQLKFQWDLALGMFEYPFVYVPHRYTTANSCTTTIGAEALCVKCESASPGAERSDARIVRGHPRGQEVDGKEQLSEKTLSPIGLKNGGLAGKSTSHPGVEPFEGGNHLGRSGPGAWAHGGRN